MAVEAYVGETYRVTAKDLTHATEGSVTSGATVTITLYDPSGQVVGMPATATADGDDWHADINLPATPGQYQATIVAVKSSATGKAKFYITLKPFP